MPTGEYGGLAERVLGLPSAPAVALVVKALIGYYPGITTWRGLCLCTVAPMMALSCPLLPSLCSACCWEAARLLSDQVLRDTLGAAALEHARQFTWEGTISSWESLLSCVARHDAPVSTMDTGPTLARNPLSASTANAT